MKDVSILIPYRPDNGPRDKAFEWVKKYYQALMPDAELCIGSCKYRIFSRSQAINDAASKATRDVFVIVDSDIFYNPKLVEESIGLLDQVPWVIPYNTIQMISEKSSFELYSTEPGFPPKMKLETTIKGGYHGGMNIVPRKHFERVGGFDGRFCGWGGEDDAFAYSMNTLCGQYKRLDEEIYHLWHPRRSGQGGLKDYDPIYNLFKRYKRANGDPKTMQRLIDERKTDQCGQCYEV
ncbi:MAG: galactosyltransferase-related protein [Bacillota bacterium]